MDIGSVLGIIISVGFTIFSIFASISYRVEDLVLYADEVSAMLVIGGTIGSLIWAYPLDRVIRAVKAFSKTFKPPNLDARGAIQNIITLSNLARRESLLALEEPVKNMNDPFLSKGIMLVVDGADPDLVRNVLETEISYIESRHSQVRSFWEYAAAVAPSYGMIGTLIGLVNMLANLGDAANLGSDMALCIITTLYGTLVATVFSNPTANKLKIFSNDELLVKEVLIEGILSIQAGDNPRIIEEKLKSFLSPALRVNKEEPATD